jgi:murein DD-endopeptidase
MRARARAPARGGLLDLLLVVVVVTAVWVRTPVGGLFDRAWQAVTGEAGELAPLTSFFVTGPPPEIVVLAEQIAVLPDVMPPVPKGGFPEPWRTAARLTLDGPLPKPGREIADGMPDLPEEERTLALLDRLYADEGDPEAVLEIVSVGKELRERAISRAEAAGEPDPRSFRGHRPYLPDDAARAADRVVSGTLALATVLELTWPIAGTHRMTSPYGWRTHPTLKTKKFHDGVDLAVPIGTPVASAQAGEIVRAGEDKVSGRYVVIDHGHGVRSSYCHLDVLEVEKGDHVGRGALIGLSGNTGRSTGPHLHFGVRIGRGTVDPARLRRTPVETVEDAAASD